MLKIGDCYNTTCIVHLSQKACMFKGCLFCNYSGAVSCLKLMILFNENSHS